jgi:hypothetical protein
MRAAWGHRVNLYAGQRHQSLQSRELVTVFMPGFLCPGFYARVLCWHKYRTSRPQSCAALPRSIGGLLDVPIKIIANRGAQCLPSFDFFYEGQGITPYFRMLMLAQLRHSIGKLPRLNRIKLQKLAPHSIVS